jgi:hypothetical protein
VILTEERQTLFDEVEEEWTKKQQLNDSADEDNNFDESEECIIKVINYLKLISIHKPQSVTRH